MLALRLFLPESWTSKRARLERAGVPIEYRTARTKPEMALAEIDRVIAAGVRFGCVLADDSLFSSGSGLNEDGWSDRNSAPRNAFPSPDGEHIGAQLQHPGTVFSRS